MFTDCPDPRETSDFHFRQLRTIRITKENENIPSKSINFLASSSKYGLLFIGMEGGFNVITLDDILILDEEKENRSIETKYSHFFVPSGTPAVLAVNSNEETLAVCIQNVSSVSINLYSLSAFFESGSAWKPFCSNTLSSSPINVQDFMWNPTVEVLFALCLSDGSLHIHEIIGMSVRTISSLQTANTISVCWSPKGKQLVAGKQNGYFTQYKPTLQEVKTVAPPDFEEGPIAVTSICWISNTVFAVVYVVGDTPNLFIVSTPKDSTIVYTNFSDVCLGNNSVSYQKFFLHLEPLWGILICASLDSIEVAVLGDMPNWVQWDLKEDGKALLPGKDGATHAVGIAVMYSAQRQIIISESESYPPMPILFLLTNNGLLVSFHMINTKSGAAILVTPSLPLECKGKEFSTDADIQVIQKGQQPSLAVSSAFVEKNASVVIETPVSSVVNKPQNTNSASFKMKNSMHLLSDQLKDDSYSFGKERPGNTTNKYEMSSLQEMQESHTQKNSTSFSAAEKVQSEVQLGKDNSYRMAIITEIQSFVKELYDFKQLQYSGSVIDADDDMISLKIFALNLQNFQNDIFETMQSVSSDIYTLKNALLESFVMVEEACSRERRRNDHSYITMLKERALDPVTAKHMQKVNRHYQYLQTQLQEVSDRLDHDWILLISNKKKTVRSSSCVSSTEAIYKTIVNNQKIIHNIKRKVNVLLKKAEEQQLRNTSKSAGWGKHKRSTQEDLSKLADEFLLNPTLAKFAHQEMGELSVTKKLSKESQDFLKTFLKRSNIITVRPTAVYSPSQSRLLSNAIPLQDLLRNDQERVLTLHPPEIKASVLTSSASNILPPKMCSETASFKPTSTNEYILEQNAPVYEPVSPPDVIDNLQSLNKNSCASGMISSLSTDKCSELCPQLLLSSTATEDSEIKCISSESPVFLQTPVFTSVVQAGSQCSTLKPPFSIANSSFTSSERKDRLWSISDITSSSIPDSAISVTSESSQIIPETPLVTSSISQSTFVNTPFAQNPTYLAPSKNLALIQTSSENDNQCTLLENNASSVTEASPSNANANLTLNSKSSCRQDGIDVQKSVLSGLADGRISSNITPSNVTKTGVLTSLNNLPNTCISGLKQSESLVSKSSAIFPPVSLVTITPQPTTMATVGSITVSSVTSSDVSFIQPSDSLVTIPSMATHSSETTSVSTVSMLGQNVTLCSSISSGSRLEAVKKTESSVTPTFGTKSTLFEKPLIPDSCTTAVPAFGETPIPNSGSFGQTSKSNPVSGGFFSQTSSFGTPTTTATTSVAISDLNAQVSTFSFGKTFGQTAGSFGLAKSFFGQNSNPVTQTGTSLSFQTGQNSNPVFGQGSFFSGLGGKASVENATKNVFDFSSGAKSSETNLFKNSGVTSLGAVNNSTGFSGSGSFSSGGGSVSQSGFGTFQPSTVLQPGGFGTAPAFGNSPAFGSSPSFGASPTFGSGNALSSVFSQQQVSSNFSNFANASSPTFGSLASQNPGFSSSSVGGGFGSQGSPAFGPSSFGNQTSSFGSSNSPPSNSSAFTQWRN